MYQTKVNYVALNGDAVEEVLHFNLNTIEVARMQGKVEGGDLEAHFKKVISNASATNDTMSLINLMLDVVLLAYGEPSADGKHFVKGPEVQARFENSLAFAQYMEDLLTQEGESLRFGQQVIAMGNRAEQAAKATGNITPMVKNQGLTNEEVLSKFAQPEPQKPTTQLTLEQQQMLATLPVDKQLAFLNLIQG